MFRPKISLKARALRYLSMREHSRLELARKLNPHMQEGDDLDVLLNFLESAKFLSNQRFSESLIHRRQARFGNQRIVAELQSHALDKEVIEELKLALHESEESRAVDVLQRKFVSPANNSEDRAKQMRFLLQRGFSSKAIRAALQSDWDCDDF